MPLPVSFLEHLAGSWPPKDWQDLTVMVAVSGGADSVALLCGLAAIRPASGTGRILAAHFHHGLRGPEADADAAFVAALAHRLQVEATIGIRDPAEPWNDAGSLEAAARSARYAFLRRAAHDAGARYVVTAHTADDQAETVLHRILRGTGLAGLGGIRRARALGPGVTLFRPLLNVRRSAIREYLASIGQPYRNDSSNDDTRFTRNRLRHELIPLLASRYNAHVVEALVRLGAQAGDAAAVLEGLAEEWIERSVTFTPRSVRVLTHELPGPRHLVREAMVHIWRRQGWPLKAMSAAHWDELARLLESSARAGRVALVRKHFPGAVLVESRQGEVHLSRQ